MSESVSKFVQKDDEVHFCVLFIFLQCKLLEGIFIQNRVRNALNSNNSACKPNKQMTRLHTLLIYLKESFKGLK